MKAFPISTDSHERLFPSHTHFLLNLHFPFFFTSFSIYTYFPLTLFSIRLHFISHSFFPLTSTLFPLSPFPTHSFPLSSTPFPTHSISHSLHFPLTPFPTHSISHSLHFPLTSTPHSPNPLPKLV